MDDTASQPEGNNPMVRGRSTNAAPESLQSAGRQTDGREAVSARERETDTLRAQLGGGNTAVQVPW